MEEYDPCHGCGYKENRIKSSWMYNHNWWWWTMSSNEESTTNVWFVSTSDVLNDSYVDDRSGNTAVVRPVIVISKSVLN